MRPPLKLSAIDQEHLQELYDQCGIARDELPYTEMFDSLCQGFQDRTFKNAHHEQVFAALLKYVRSGGNPAKENRDPLTLTEDHVKQIKTLLPRHAKGGKLLPYGDEFESAHKEFVKLSGKELVAAEFWRAVSKSASPKRKPPVRKAVAAAVVAAGDDDDLE